LPWAGFERLRQSRWSRPFWLDRPDVFGDARPEGEAVPEDWGAVSDLAVFDEKSCAYGALIDLIDSVLKFQSNFPFEMRKVASAELAAP